MNNRQLEDLLEQKHTEALARALDMSTEEVEEWVVNDYPDTSDDGLVYGHVVEISGDAPPELIERLGGTSLNIGPVDVDEE